MEHTTHLWLFFVLVLGIVLLPGLDMAFVFASALGGDRRAGRSAVAGIVSGSACHVPRSPFRHTPAQLGEDLKLA